MEYSSTRPVTSLQSPTNHMSTENVQNYTEGGSNHSNETGVLSPGQYNMYDEKQHYQYQNQAPSLNQLLQNNQYGPYGNSPLRPQVPSNYQTNYWNLPRSQNENACMYYTQYQDSYPQHSNDVAYSKVDKMKSNDHPMPPSDTDNNYNSEGRSYQNDDSEKLRPNMNEWKINNIKFESSSPKDNTSKPETEKKIEKPNSVEMSNSTSLKSESHLNTDYNSNTSSSETSEKNDTVSQNSNYVIENKANQSHLKQNPGGYENMNYNQMMMYQNANYYSQMRYPSPQNNVHNYMGSGGSPMMHRPPIVNYPPYMQAASTAPGYGYPQMAMHQSRMPYNVHGPYGPRGTQSPFSGHQDVYMNGTIPPLYSGVTVKDSMDRKDDINPPLTSIKHEVSDSGSTSNKSATAKASSKTKNATKTPQSESHPTTPVSNTIPSPSQTSMSSIIDENDDSVSSLGPNEASMVHQQQQQQQHPNTQYGQTQSQAPPPPILYPQSYSNNSHSVMGPYPGHGPPPPVIPQSQPQRPFAPSPNMIPSRQYHHNNEPPNNNSNNSCFQKLLELGAEPERGPWVERYLKFMHENSTPLGAVPTVVKQPLDLFRLYHAVRERGGLLNVVKTKRWKEICHIVNVNASASGAYTLRRNYIKCLLDYECRFDRNGVDPSPILQEIQSLSDKKKKSTARTTGSSSSSTISSGPASQHPTDFVSGQNPATARPSPLLPPPTHSPDFIAGHPASFPGHGQYGHNAAMHNGALMHRPPPMNYAGQRSPYPGGPPFAGPRMMGFNAPVASHMHQPVRYDSPMPANWTKPLPISQQQQQQQWSSPSSSSNSNSTNPMQMPMSPGTPSNSVSNIPPNDSFEVSGKDSTKQDSSASRYPISDNVVKPPDNFPEKDLDKIENPSKSDPNYYNQAYGGYGGSGTDITYDYYHHSKNLSTNTNAPHPSSMQYPGFPFSRQYGSAFRQSGPSSLSSFPSYYPPNPNYGYPPPPQQQPPGISATSSNCSSSSSVPNNSHNMANSSTSIHHSPYYPIGSLQEHTRRMEWKSNYGGMPPPPPPPPPLSQTTSSLSSALSTSSNGPLSSARGSLPPNTSPMNLGDRSSHPQYHSSVSPHCNYPNNQSTQRPQPNAGQLSTTNMMMTQSRHMMQSSPIVNHSNINSSLANDTSTFLGKSQQGPLTLANAASDHINSLSSSVNGHSRSAQIDNSRLTQSYPSQFAYSKSNSNLLKRYDHLFPPNCVEATLPDYSKKRKYTSKDIRAFNPATVTMALKSGLLGEVSWALNYLNIWSRDDSFYDKLTLKNMMPLFQALMDVWRNSLGSVFGYDQFIRDLELPIHLEDQLTKRDLEKVVTKIDGPFKEGDNGIDEKMEIIADKLTESFDCGKYNWDKNGLTVKLDCGAKLDSVIGGGGDLLRFVMAMTEDDRGEVASARGPSLGDLWDVGGSDSTFHIMPPLQSQRGAMARTDWHTHLHDRHILPSDSCEPPEIKRTRCHSPSTSCRSTSPPNLLHEEDAGGCGQGSPGIEVHRFQSKSDVDSVVESLLFEVDRVEEEKMLRCLCVSTVVRNLSFVAGNDRVMGGNRCLLVILARLLLLGHVHDNGTKEAPWWHRWMDDVREHVLVTLVNISSYLELDSCPDVIVRPLVVGLLHWLTCQSAEAEDALPSHRVLGCRRLALECVMRLCVHERNIDYLVSSPASGTGDCTVRRLFDYLAASFCHPEVQVVKEMALAVMHYLSSPAAAASGALGSVYLASAEPSVIGGLISFIEITESQIRHVVDNMGMEALQARPELMGTSLEFLRHSGALLARLAGHEVNRPRFSRDHEMRMLNLVISTVLDQTVAQSISGVLYSLSGHDDASAGANASASTNASNHGGASGGTGHRDNHGRFKSFLTFDDLSFCDKEAKDCASDCPRDQSDRRGPREGADDNVIMSDRRDSMIGDQKEEVIGGDKVVTDVLDCDQRDDEGGVIESGKDGLIITGDQRDVVLGDNGLMEESDRRHIVVCDEREVIESDQRDVMESDQRDVMESDQTGEVIESDPREAIACDSYIRGSQVVGDNICTKNESAEICPKTETGQVVDGR